MIPRVVLFRVVSETPQGRSGFGVLVPLPLRPLLPWLWLRLWLWLEKRTPVEEFREAEKKRVR